MQSSTQLHRFFKENNVIEKNIHIIWLGSPLLKIHYKRIVTWKKLNKTYEVMLWTDSDNIEHIRSQIGDLNIKVANLNTLSGMKSIKPAVDKLIEVREDKLPANYAAASDIYRLIILHELGGWYFDTDIMPFDVSMVSVDRNIKFNLHMIQHDSKCFRSACPDAIGTSKQNVFTRLLMRHVHHFLKVLNDERIIKLIRSSKSSVRYLGTCWTTGAILYHAISKILINHIPLEENTRIKDVYFSSFNAKIVDKFEKTWIFDYKNAHGSHKALPGIELDYKFTGNMSKKFTTPVKDAITILDNLYDSIRSVDIIHHDLADMECTDSRPYYVASNASA